MCKVFGMRPPPPLVGGVSHPDFDLFALQPRRGGISVERLGTITVNPVGVTSTTFDKISGISQKDSEATIYKRSLNTRL